MPTPNIVVLGTGMAGFGAAHRLHSEGITPTMYDKNGYYGGHTASFRNELGFLFDVGPHISFTKDSRIQELFANSVDQQYETLPISLNNYWNGYWPKHPVQLNLHELPDAVYTEISPHLCGKYEHRLAGPSDLSSEPRRSTTGCTFALGSAGSLHHPFPLSQCRRFCELS